MTMMMMMMMMAIVHGYHGNIKSAANTGGSGGA
jgi:hypothetical protein